jgi:hypothetical protein
MDLLDRMYDLMKQWALANDIVSADNGIFKHASAYTNKVMQTQGRLLDLLECMGSSERPIFILVDYWWMKYKDFFQLGMTLLQVNRPMSSLKD